MGDRVELDRRRLLLGLAALPLVGCGWRRPPPTPTPVPYVGPDVAALRVGQELRVRMLVACSDFPELGGPTYLRPTCYYEGYWFRLVIPFERRETFTLAVGGPPEVQLVDRVVDARGSVVRNGMWSEIILSGVDQMRIATGWSPPKVPTRVPSVKPA